MAGALTPARLMRAVITAAHERVHRLAACTAWQIHYAYFARAGFTEAARAEAGNLGARLVDLETLDADLRRGLE